MFASSYYEGLFVKLERLINQIAEVAAELRALRQGAGTDALDGPGGEGGGGLFFDIPGGASADRSDRRGPEAACSAEPSLPDPGLVREIIRQRRLRSRFFNGELFADPAWDMLLDLAAATVEKRQVSVTSLCIASGVPPTTALRWIGALTQQGLLKRVDDPQDGRRAFIVFTDQGVTAMARYFEMRGADAAAPV